MKVKNYIFEFSFLHVSSCLFFSIIKSPGEFSFSSDTVDGGMDIMKLAWNQKKKKKQEACNRFDMRIYFFCNLKNRCLHRSAKRLITIK